MELLPAARVQTQTAGGAAEKKHHQTRHCLVFSRFQLSGRQYGLLAQIALKVARLPRVLW